MAEDNVDQTAAEDDPWGAALAEQTEAEESQKKHIPEEEGLTTKPAEATIFKDLSTSDIQTNTPNDIDFILDIPVQLTVELGRTKIAIKNL